MTCEHPPPPPPTAVPSALPHPLSVLFSCLFLSLTFFIFSFLLTRRSDDVWIIQVCLSLIRRSRDRPLKADMTHHLFSVCSSTPPGVHFVNSWTQFGVRWHQNSRAWVPLLMLANQMPPSTQVSPASCYLDNIYRISDPVMVGCLVSDRFTESLKVSVFYSSIVQRVPG